MERWLEGRRSGLEIGEVWKSDSGQAKRRSGLSPFSCITLNQSEPGSLVLNRVVRDIFP